MSWHHGRMCAFDLETTAPNPREARIVTACAAEVGGGTDVDSWTRVADPGVEIPEGAARIHGFTTERARAEGRPAREVVGELIDRLATAALGRPLVIFNARYDLTVLDREARRHGLEPLQDRIALFVVDPLVLDKWLDRYRGGSRKLEAICQHYGARLDDAHDAAFDAIAAARVAWCIGERGAVVRRYANEQRELSARWEAIRDDLALLHEAQISMALDQTLSLADHFDEKAAGLEARGDHEAAAAKRVDAAQARRDRWPLIPVEGDEGLVAA